MKLTAVHWAIITIILLALLQIVLLVLAPTWNAGP